MAKRAAKASTTVSLTHPDRLFWPEEGLTKQGLAEYYSQIADWVLPHVVDRPLSLVRCPAGWQDQCFFQKHAWSGMHEAVHRRTIRDEEVLFIRDLDGLVALVQSGVLEIHPWGSRLSGIDRPDRITIDLDPDEGVGWQDVIAGAREVRDRLRDMGLASFVKTTGGKGLHVVVPLTPKAGWDEAGAFAKGLAEVMEADAPERYVATMAKDQRVGRIFVDYLRNSRGSTAVAAYSTRARARAPVSTPLAWEELSSLIGPAFHVVRNLPERVANLREDPWREILSVRQMLPAARKAPASRA